jgi:hypothetical protein
MKTHKKSPVLALFTTYLHFFALYQQMQAMQARLQQFFNEIKDLAVTLKAKRLEKAF